MTNWDIKAFRELTYVNRLQAEIIDNLFSELCLHESMEDIEKNVNLGFIKEASNIMSKYDACDKCKDKEDKECQS